MKPDRSIVLAIITVVLVALLLWLIPSIVYVVDERQMAVVLQFGNPVAERTEPGVYFKLPFVQEVTKLPKTRQLWGDDHRNPLPDLPTKDDKKIEVVPWAIWRVKEPTIFVQRLRTMENAEQRVAQFVRGGIRDVITQYDLAELVRSSQRELSIHAEQAGAVVPPDDEAAGLQPTRVKVKIQFGRQKILDKIKQDARRRLGSGTDADEAVRGIELVDLGISQIEFVESVRIKTFDRWVAERQAISARNVNEGERMKQEIVNKAGAEVQRIEGEGQRTSNEIRGRIDAEIIRKYAQAIEEAGEFYTFVRTLEAYKNSIGRDTRLILTTDSELLRMLKGLDHIPPGGATADRAQAIPRPLDRVTVP